jgi:hypothetical protein
LRHRPATSGNYQGAKAVTGKLSELTIAPNGFGLKLTRDGGYYRREHEAVFGRRSSHHAR